jgi:O-antigen/teichoic acid export membrane protein
MIDKVKTLGKETLIYGTSTIVARLLNFFLVPLYTYYLAPQDYGIIAAVFAFMALTNIIYQYGMDQAYLRFAKENKTKELFATPLIAVFTSGVFISLILWSLSAPIANLLGIGAKYNYLIKLACFVMALDALNIVPFAKLRFDHKPWQFMLTRTASIVVNVIGNILVLAYFKSGVEGIFIAGIFASLASLLLLLPMTIKNFVFRFDKNIFKEMFAFSWPFIPAGMASILVNVIDKPLLIHLVGLKAVGIYQANFKIGVFMMLVVSMFDQAWRPFFIQYSSQKDAKELFSQIFTYFTAITTWIFLGLTFLMPVIIKTPIFGHHLIAPAYWPGLKIIPLILGGYLFYGFYINFMVAPVLTKKTRVLMWITLLGAASSILTNLTLVPLVGIIGAGWAIFISYIVMALSLFIFLQKKYPINYEYKKIGFIFGIVLIWLGLNSFINSLAGQIILLIVYPLIISFVLDKNKFLKIKKLLLKRRKH